jgi:hypothetical protein
LVNSDLGAFVGELVVNGEWAVNFRRELDAEHLVLWGRLNEKLQGVSLSDVEDSVQRALENDGMFSTKSLYRHLSFGGVRSRWIEEVWGLKIPLKIKIFMWQIYNDRLQTAD